MKPIALASPALVSASLVAAVAVAGAARPHYGGTLRVETVATLRSINPASAPSDDHILSLAFETLTRVDADAGLQPSLALSWDRDGAARWRVKLRRGVVLHDGSILEPWQVAAALRAVESRWKIATDGDTLIIEADGGADVPWLLAEPQRAVVVRPAPDRLLGTGPFRVERLDGETVTLRAHDGYRGGRPFLDAVEVRMGRTLPQQLADLESGRADLVSVQPADVRRLAQRGLRVVESRPLELVALVFEPHRATDTHDAIRRTIAAAVDRQTLCNVLLQQHASPATALLPAWVSGYVRDTPDKRAVLSRAAVAALPLERRELVLRVEPADPLAPSIAERVAVDAREAGFSIKVQTPAGLAPRPDARLVRIRISPTTPDRALAALVQRLGPRVAADALPQGVTVGAPLDAIYRAEAALLDRRVVVPLVHVPDLYGVADRVWSWRSKPIQGSGAWDFADVALAMRRVQP